MKVSIRVVSFLLEIKRSPSGIELTDSLAANLQADSALLEEVPEDNEVDVEGEIGEEAKEAIVKTEVYSNLTNFVWTGFLIFRF